MTTIDDLVRIVMEAHYTFRSHEALVQETIANAFLKEGIRFEREVVLAPGDRIDFLVGSLGLEVKVVGSEATVLRQLQRYAQSERVTELLLFTLRMQLGRGFPPSLSGKPVRVACYPGGL